MFVRPQWPCLLASCLLLGSSLAKAQDSEAGSPTPGAVSNQAGVGGQPTVLPPSSEPGSTVLAPATPTASNSPQVLDTSTSPKFYTITASLREAYDDNVFTSRYDKVSSPVTELSPSILVSLPSRDSTFSGRLTLGLNYYSDRPGNQFDKTAEVLLRYTHQFTDRFSLDVREQGGYYSQPDILGGVGTLFYDGSFVQNIATAVFNAQWTPLFGTTSTYSNIVVDYENSDVGRYQNSDENTFDQDFRFAVFPKINLVAGGIIDDLDYFNFQRGYISYTLDGGVDWQALPNLSFSVRGGLELTDTDNSTSELSPYASASMDWKLGKRSEFSANYSHSVEPTDVFDALGEEADRLSLRFNYDLTSRISVHAAATGTYAEYTDSLLEGGVSGFNEFDLGLDLGGEYHIDSNFSVETGYFLSDVSSGESGRDYVRNQIFLGIRGTY